MGLLLRAHNNYGMCNKLFIAQQKLVADNMNNWPRSAKCSPVVVLQVSVYCCITGNHLTKSVAVPE